ncbi:MAG: acetylglutamate kinase [bacterium]|nr:acetylglutamate kinase [bacterium]
MQRLAERAGILIEALPYIKRYFGRTMVIKYGGNAMISEDLKQAVIEDVILMRYVGMNPVLVHGGGPEISSTMKRMGKEAEFVGGLRVTDKATMEIAQMVLVGKINTEIVSLINKHGGQAVGLSGKDGNLIRADKVAPRLNGDVPVDLGYVGDVAAIDPSILVTLTEKGYIPVISPVGIGTEGESLNINADHAAGAVAAALGAAKLILLTDIEGIMRDKNDSSTLVSALNISAARAAVSDGMVDKGMIPKVEACITALEAGVERAHIIDGRIQHSLLMEIFTDRGIGTMIAEEGEKVAG